MVAKKGAALTLYILFFFSRFSHGFAFVLPQILLGTVDEEAFIFCNVSIKC